MSMTRSNGLPTTFRIAWAALLALSLASPVDAQPLFPLPRFGSGSYLAGFEAADFDGDGLPDLVINDQYDDQVRLERGQGDGRFEPWLTYDVDAPGSLQVADFDGDSELDFAVVTSHDNAIDIFVANAGSFTQVTSVPLLPTDSYNLGSFGHGDFDGDGITDLAYTIRFAPPGPGVVVLLGNGDGTFQDGLLTPCGFSHLKLMVGDVNTDGRDDIVLAASSASTIELLLATPSGAMAEPTIITGAPTPHVGALGDFNNDGALDYLSAHSGSGTESVVYFGAGDGTFAAGPLVPAIYSLDMITADLDGDGALDVLYTSIGPIRSLYGNGDGTFSAGPTFEVRAHQLGVADINDDGQLDILGRDPDAVTAVLSNGGSYRQIRVFDTPYGHVRGLSHDDVDGDGCEDIVVVQGGGDEIAILTGIAGSLSVESTMPAPASPSDLVLADVDGDGNRDIIVASESQNLIALRLADGAGGYGTPTTFATGYGPRRLAVSDVDADGHADVIAVNAISHDVSVLLGIGNGSFEAETRWQTMSFPKAIAASDVNGDGHVDLAVAGAGGVWVHYGFGDGTFASPLAPLTGEFLDVQAADADGDGTAELYAIDASQSAVHILTATGLVGFATTTHPTLPEYTTLAIGDVDGDAHVDLVTLHGSRATFAIHAGDGAGGFEPRDVFHGLDHATEVAMGDFDGDGRLDIAMTSDEYSAFNSVALSLSLSGVADFIRGDDNRDGVLDIADAISILAALFPLGPVDSSCLDARDANDDGGLDIGDAIFVLGAVFTSGAPLPPPPFPDCGRDPTIDDTLDCTAFAACP